MVTDTYQFPMGQAMLTIYPPVGAGDLNEQGLTFLCSAGDFAPDHRRHGRKHGEEAGGAVRPAGYRGAGGGTPRLPVQQHRRILQQMRPETAIISVGDNSYGHPTQEAMDRLSRNGATVYRTDRQGNVLVTVNGGT